MTDLTTIDQVQKVLMTGDLSSLRPEQKVAYYNKVCELVGLNPLTKPFDYLKLNGKEVLYANKGCGEQLRMRHNISLKIVSREKIDDVYVVTAEATGKDGRTDSATGAVPIVGLKGDALANAYMKCETKAKRRVTLSICGLNMLDETEVETITPKPNQILMDQPGPEDGVMSTEYYITFGQWKGRTIAQVYRDHGKDRLHNYLSHLESSAQKENKPIRPEVQDFIERVEDYVASQENAPLQRGEYSAADRYADHAGWNPPIEDPGANG